MSADALQVYAGLETLTGAAERRASAPSSSTGCCRSCPSTRPSAPASTRELAHAEIDGLLAEGRRPIVVGGTGLYLRAALTELSLRPVARGGVRERWLGELERRGPEALHAILARRAPWAAAEIDPTDRQRIVRALELLDAGELEPPQRRVRAVDRRHPPPDAAGRAGDGARTAVRADRRTRRRDARRRRRRTRSAARAAAGASDTARKALGFEELLAGDVEAMKRRTRNYARRQLTWMRKLAAVNVLDATGRDRRRRWPPRSHELWLRTPA